ncbi:MAG: hypothetical protein KBF75_11820 [Saprospiraceae bacterium]|jgi:hypothetical protein|nr:hypothetical protein [Saprospiraceae bacterium]
MKITFLALFILACTAGNMNVFKNIEKDTATAISNQCIHYSGNTYTIFYNQTSKHFYIVRFVAKPQIPANIKFIQYSTGQLRMSNMDNNEILNFSLDDNIYSITEAFGRSYEKTLLINGSGQQGFITDPGIIGGVVELSCKCKKNGTKADCDHGGEGSNGCAVQDGGGVSPFNWENNCSVSCNEGYYACCNKSPVKNDSSFIVTPVIL